MNDTYTTNQQTKYKYLEINLSACWLIIFQNIQNQSIRLWWWW